MPTSLIVDNTTDWTGITDVLPGMAIVAIPISTKPFPVGQFKQPHYVFTLSEKEWLFMPAKSYVSLNDKIDDYIQNDFLKNYNKKYESFSALFQELRQWFKFHIVKC